MESGEKSFISSCVSHFKFIYSHLLELFCLNIFQSLKLNVLFYYYYYDQVMKESFEAF